MTVKAPVMCLTFTIAFGILAGGLGAFQQGMNDITLDGMVVVKPVDGRRVVVAVDTSNEGRAADRFVDHVFLFTAAEPIEFSSATGTGRAHVEFADHSLTVVAENGKQIFEFIVAGINAEASTARPGVVRFAHAIGLSHYTGWSGLRLTDLREIKRTTDCDACYEAGGHRLRFPA